MESPRPIEDVAPAPVSSASDSRARGPHPLAGLAGDPDRLGAILRAADVVIGEVPPLRNALVAWLVLIAARKVIPADPRSLGYHLWTRGWKLLEPGERPRAGDVFLVAGTDKRPTHVGVVVKASTDGTWFLAIDDALTPGERPYRRPVAGDDRHPPVASFLRFS